MKTKHSKKKEKEVHYVEYIIEMVQNNHNIKPMAGLTLSCEHFGEESLNVGNDMQVKTCISWYKSIAKNAD